MKVNEDIKRRLVENLESWKEMIDDTINMYINEIKNIGTVEELMRIKRDLLIDFVYKIPLSRDYCYFCLADMAYDKSCGECEYARYHGQCSSDQSTYSNIEKAAHKLIAELERYYSGEMYE